MTAGDEGTARFECPECGERYEMHVCVDDVQGCCPGCQERMRDRALRPDDNQRDLEEWTT